MKSHSLVGLLLAACCLSVAAAGAARLYLQKEIIACTRTLREVLASA